MKKEGPMSLTECERLAKEVGFDSMRFMAMFPAGPKTCKWLDAYFGLFMIEELGDGFMSVDAVDDRFPDLVCVPLLEEAEA